MTKTLGTKYAVLLVQQNSEELCTTHNDTHDVWQPAIFDSEGDAGKFYDDITSIRGNDNNYYKIVEVFLIY